MTQHLDGYGLKQSRCTRQEGERARFVRAHR